MTGEREREREGVGEGGKFPSHDTRKTGVGEKRWWWWWEGRIKTKIQSRSGVDCPLRRVHRWKGARLGVDLRH